MTCCDETHDLLRDPAMQLSGTTVASRKHLGQFSFASVSGRHVLFVHVVHIEHCL